MPDISVQIESPSGTPIVVGTNQPLLLIGGPCALESEELARTIAGTMQEICDRLGISYVFKASFDKANRTSLDSYRGPGLKDGLATLAAIREELIPKLTVSLKVDKEANMGIVGDIKQELRKASAFRINYTTATGDAKANLD